MPPREYSYVDAYIALHTLHRLAEDGLRLRLSFSPREGMFHVEAWGWPFREPGPTARDVPRTFEGIDPNEAPCLASSPSLTEAIETMLDAYRSERHAAPPKDELGE